MELSGAGRQAIPGGELVPVPQALTHRFSLDYTTLDMSDALLEKVGAKREDVVGHNVFEAFPDDPDGAQLLKSSLDRVIATHRPDELPVLRYDVGDRCCYWRLKHWPVFNDDGELVAIDQVAEDLTADVALERLKFKRRHRAYLFQNGFVALVALLFLVTSISFFLDPVAIERAVPPVPPYDYYWNAIYLVGSIMVLFGLFSRRVGVEAAGHTVLVPGLVLNDVLAALTIGVHATTFIVAVFAIASGLRAYGLIAGWREDGDE